MLLWLYFSLFLVAPLAAVNPYYLHYDKETDRHGVFYRNSYGQKGGRLQTANKFLQNLLLVQSLQWSKDSRHQRIHIRNSQLFY